MPYSFCLLGTDTDTSAWTLRGAYGACVRDTCKSREISFLQFRAMRAALHQTLKFCAVQGKNGAGVWKMLHPPKMEVWPDQNKTSEGLQFASSLGTVSHKMRRALRNLFSVVEQTQCLFKGERRDAPSVKQSCEFVWSGRRHENCDSIFSVREIMRRKTQVSDSQKRCVRVCSTLT